MQKSNEINELAMALCKVQKDLKAAPKDTENLYFKSKYSDLATIIETAKDLLTQNDLAISQTMNATDGSTMELTTILMHKSGQWIESTLTMKPVQATPQGIGSAITYARRYTYAAIIGLSSEVDDDGEQASHNDTETKEYCKHENKEETPALYGTRKGDMMIKCKDCKKFIGWASKEVSL